MRRIPLSLLRRDRSASQQYLRRDPAMKSPMLRIPSSQQRQRGVVLFVALIAMVILSLAGLALMRGGKRGTGLPGNSPSRHSSQNPVNEPIEEAIKAIFKAKTLPSQTS